VTEEDDAMFTVGNRFPDRRSRRGGVSIDSGYVHLGLVGNHPDLKHLPFPLAADLKRELDSAVGILAPGGRA
jgi:lipoyl-dependent peroxiredoxin subunit C